MLHEWAWVWVPAIWIGLTFGVLALVGGASKLEEKQRIRDEYERWKGLR